MNNADLRKIKEMCDLNGISTPGELLKNAKYLPDYILNSATKCEELRVASEKRFAAINNTFANDVYYNNGRKGNQRLHGGTCTFIEKIEPYTTGESYINAGSYRSLKPSNCPSGQMCKIEYTGKQSAHGKQTHASYLYLKGLIDSGQTVSDGYRYADYPSAKLVGLFYEDYYVPLCDSVDRLISELTRFGREFSFKLFVNNRS